MTGSDGWLLADKHVGAISTFQLTVGYASLYPQREHQTNHGDPTGQGADACWCRARSNQHTSGQITKCNLKDGQLSAIRNHIKNV